MFSNRTKALNTTGWLLHLAGAAVIAMFLTVSYFGLSASFAWKISGRAERIAELEKYLNRAPSIRKKHAALQQALARIKQRVQEIDQRMPDDAREAEFLGQMTEAAQQTGLTIRDYRRGENTEMTSHFQLEVRILGEGSYGSICRFLERIHELPRAVAIDKMRISTEKENNVYPVDMTFLLHYHVAEQKATEKETING
jgi:Tfp pilus assembly protein PilO